MRERSPHDSFDDYFDEDLRGRMAAAAAEHGAALASHLVSALSLVMNRGTPLRGVEIFGSDGVCRLHFADGTTVLTKSIDRGGLGLTAVAVTRGASVLVTEIRRDGAGVRAVLAWDGRHRVEIDV
ncbi:MAG TPA: hypothetical protein VLR88_04230, partial [Propionibacteriaceae bacterium]|nr:hypothetical protein [Propionibacteriaceae bacterium]